MTALFNWAVLAYHTSYIYRHEDQYAAAAAAYLRERIEAEFVPVDQANDHSMCHRDGCSLTGIPYGLASCGCWDTELRARAEAAEASVKVMEEALQWVLDHDPKQPGLRFESYEGLLESLMGRPRQALGGEHE